VRAADNASLEGGGTAPDGSAFTREGSTLLRLNHYRMPACLTWGAVASEQRGVAALAQRSSLQHFSAGAEERLPARRRPPTPHAEHPAFLQRACAFSTESQA